MTFICDLLPSIWTRSTAPHTRRWRIPSRMAASSLGIDTLRYWRLHWRAEWRTVHRGTGTKTCSAHTSVVSTEIERKTCSVHTSAMSTEIDRKTCSAHTSAMSTETDRKTCSVQTPAMSTEIDRKTCSVQTPAMSNEIDRKTCSVHTSAMSTEIDRKTCSAHTSVVSTETDTCNVETCGYQSPNIWLLSDRLLDSVQQCIRITIKCNQLWCRYDRIPSESMLIIMMFACR